MAWHQRPNVSTARLSAMENEYSPASVDWMLPPQMLNDWSNRNGIVAAARAAGAGNRSFASRPAAYAASGKDSKPAVVTSFIAMPYGSTTSSATIATAGMTG